MECTNNKRIAVCFSGQLRTWKKCIPTWKTFFENLKKNYNVSQIDIFSHTWDHNDIPGTTTLYSSTFNCEKISPLEIKQYINQLNPVSYKVDDLDTSKNTKEQSLYLQHRDFLNDKTPIIAWMSPALYSIMYSAFLKKKHEIEHNFIYDVCIKMRNDVFFEKEHTDESIVNLLHPLQNYVYSAHNRINQNQKFFKRSLGDLVWYSNSHTFDILSDFYKWIPFMEEDVFKGCFFPENVFFFYTKMFNKHITSHTLCFKIARSKNYINYIKKQNKKLGGWEKYVD